MERKTVTNNEGKESNRQDRERRLCVSTPGGATSIAIHHDGRREYKSICEKKRWQEKKNAMKKPFAANDRQNCFRPMQRSNHDNHSRRKNLPSLLSSFANNRLCQLRAALIIPFMIRSIAMMMTMTMAIKKQQIKKAREKGPLEFVLCFCSRFCCRSLKR